jgi:chaperonin GroEL (HSP60 family)
VLKGLLRTRSLDVTVAKEIELEVVKKALSWPVRQIAINAGEDGSIVVGKIQDKDTYAYG